MADLAKTSKRVTVTISGVNVEVDPNVFDDMRVIDWLYQIQSAKDDPSGTGALAIVPLFRTIVGAKTPQLMKALAEKDGRVPIEKAVNAITTIMEKINPNS